VRLLLDTHTFIAWDDNKLPKQVTKAIQEAQEVYVSSAVAWEIAIKCGIGKLAARANVVTALGEYDFQELPITILHAQQVRSLPPIHRDPFDRILIAQAQCEDLTLVSNDAMVCQYSVPIFWTSR
jgi:PIN domain nuclease of toxin-antitoxin system